MSNSTYDAIVVGGGSVGVPAAYSLAQRGLKVLVLDRRPAVRQEVASLAVDGKALLPEVASHATRFERDFWAAKTEALK